MNMSRNKRVMLLISPQSYRNQAFLKAAERIGIEAVQAIDVPEMLASEWGVELGVEFNKPESAVEQITRYIQGHPVDAVLSLDDSATLIASRVSNELGLPHNSPGAAVAARDKWVMRERLHESGVLAPLAFRYDLDSSESDLRDYTRFPCVVKPNILSGSRGVIRADTTDELLAAFERTRQILLADGFTSKNAGIVIEDYLPGVEVALEGILTDGELTVLALFDKPDPLEGPFFEETIYTTPSRLPADVQEQIAHSTEQASAALGLRTGPVHAELRVNDAGAWIIEIAGRSIGGLCSTILEFGTGQSLEELILRHAIGEEVSKASRNESAVGVMMIPIPRAGILRCVTGEDEAAAVPGITGIQISARLNHPIVPLPEGSSYLGFIFAEGETPAEVEHALRTAHDRLEFKISSQIRLTQQPASLTGA